MSQEIIKTQEPLTQMDIHRATANYLKMCLDKRMKHYAHGEMETHN